MHKFKVGDVVRRTEDVPAHLVSVTEIRRDEHYTIDSIQKDGDICLRESKQPWFPFDPAKFELVLPADPADDPWSREQALRLRKAAEHAIAVYNEYIQKQPRLEPINIK